MPQNQYKWLWVTLAGVLFLLLAFFLLATQLSLAKIPLPLYFFLVLLSAICATAFLTGALKSTAAWEGDFFKGKLQLTGSVVVFLLIIIAGYYFRPREEKNMAALHVVLVPNEPGGRFTPSDQLFVFLNQETKISGIDSTGHTSVKNIPLSSLDDSIRVQVKLAQYNFAVRGDTTLRWDGSDRLMKLPVVLKHDKIEVNGKIVTMDKNRVRALGGVDVFFPNWNLRQQTKSDGSFQFFVNARFGEQATLEVWESNTRLYSGLVNLAPHLNITIE